MTRKRIEKDLANKIMYESAFVCAICQKPQGQIHHIDGDHSNNAENNLIFLCLSHHGEAHSKGTMSRNLGAAELAHAKNKWCSTVKNRRELASTLDGQLSLHGASSISSLGVTWAYINHNRVAQIANQISLSEKTKQILAFCIERGIVDNSGIIIQPKDYKKGSSFLYNSIYDCLPHGDDQRFHQLYTSFVDDLSRTIQPVHLEKEWWSEGIIEELIKAGSFIFVQQKMFFKVVSEDTFNQHRRVQFKKKNVRLEFFIDSKNMFGTTSMTISFSGGNSCSAFLHVKSIDKDDDGTLLIKCTPIGLGVSFY